MSFVHQLTSSKLMKRLGNKRRGNNSFISGALLGAGVMALGMNAMRNQEGNEKSNPLQQSKQHNNPEVKKSTNKSSIQNIIQNYGKNDPGLKMMMQEFSNELNGADKKEEESKQHATKNQS